MKDKLSPNLRAALSTSVWGDLCWHCHILCYCWHHSHPSSPCPASHHTMRPPLQRTAIRPRYTHSHLSITKDQEGIMASRVCHFFRHLTSLQSLTLWITQRHKESSDIFRFYYTFNEQFSFCIRITCQLSWWDAENNGRKWRDGCDGCIQCPEYLLQWANTPGEGITDINGAMSCQNVVTHRRSYKDIIIQQLIQVSTVPSTGSSIITFPK